MSNLDSAGVNSNLDHTYTNLAPLSDPAKDALESGLNPQQFVFAEPEEPEPEAKKSVKKQAKKRAKG